MKYIFNVAPSDFILAGRAIKHALDNPDDFVINSPKVWIVEYEDGYIFNVVRRKASYSVYKQEEQLELPI